MKRDLSRALTTRTTERGATQPVVTQSHLPEPNGLLDGPAHRADRDAAGGRRVVDRDGLREADLTRGQSPCRIQATPMML